MPRVMEIATPLGEDVLLFHGMHAREEMSRLCEYQLDLLSPKDDINLDDILGKNVTVKLALPDDSTRYFNGFVTRFAQGGTYGRYNRYSAVVRPWLWFLTRTTDCRIFQEMNVPDIVKKVFADHPTADFKLELTGTYRKWNYCVQYRETDFNFVSRLMEEEGIYYYFRHTDGHDTLVLTDSTSKHAPVARLREDPVHRARAAGEAGARAHQRWDFGREIQPGVYVHDDYDLERPSVELKTEGAAARLHAERLRGLRLSRALPAEGRRRAVRRRCASTSSARSSRRRRRSTNAQRASRSGRCSRSRTIRATTRIAST